MTITRHMNTSRLATLATAAVLSLGLLAGWSSQSAMAQDASQAATEQREAVFSVPDMSCPMCPITVRRALSNVDGVIEAEADLKTRQARALFDPARTDTATLIAAIENSGFSAQLKAGEHE